MTDYKKQVEAARWKVLDLLPRGNLELDKAIVEYGYACAAQARAAALEEAAVACDELVNDENSDDYRNSADWCATRIRALKETP